MSASRINRNNRERGKAFENKVAKLLGFIRVPYSGSAEEYGLGDVRDKESQKDARWIGECKTMTPKSTAEINYIIQAKWLIGKNSIIARAKKQGNKFAFLTFTKRGTAQSFSIVTTDDLKMYIDAIDILRTEKLISDTTDADTVREQIATIKHHIVLEEEAEEQAYATRLAEEMEILRKRVRNETTKNNTD